MKANAPKKIYRTTFYLDDDKGDTKWKKAPVAGAENIEYIRIDVVVEKIEKYLKDRLLRYIDYCERGVGVSTEEFIDNFIKYIKEE